MVVPLRVIAIVYLVAPGPLSRARACSASSSSAASQPLEIDGPQQAKIKKESNITAQDLHQIRIGVLLFLPSFVPFLIPLSPSLYGTDDDADDDQSASATLDQSNELSAVNE